MLVISGVGVIAFGIWSIIKAVLYIALIPVEQLTETEMNAELQEMQELGMTDRGTGYLIAGIILLILVVDFLVRLYIGKSAFADGRRLRRKSSAYIVMAVILSSFLFLSMISRAVSLGSAHGSMWTESASFAGDVSIIIDMTSMLALIEMIIAAEMVRKLRWELGATETEGE